MCMSTSPARAAATTGEHVGIATGGDVVHDGRAGGERSLGDRGLAGVDADRHGRLGREPHDHGQHPVALLGGSRTGVAPGRVDSPPTSSTSAPAATSASPCATAASGSRNRPPSEKESGVTLTMPITAGRTPQTDDQANIAWQDTGLRPRPRLYRYGRFAA